MFVRGCHFWGRASTLGSSSLDFGSCDFPLCRKPRRGVRACTGWRLRQGRDRQAAAPGADQGSCSRSRASKNARSATLPAALAVRSDQNMPPRSRAGNGWPLRKISHSHGSREWPRWTTTTLYSSLPGGRLMGVCHALRSDECYRRLAALLRCSINRGIMLARCTARARLGGSACRQSSS